MNIAQLVFCWPREAKYSCEPETYEGWAIEHHSLELGTTPLRIGDIRHWEDLDWKVAKIEAYAAQGDTHSRFSVVMLTLDGAEPQHDPWDEDDPQLMSICISGEDFVFGWPEHSEFLPKLGGSAPQLDGWEVASLQDFEGLHVTSRYTRVRVCWCAPTRVSEPTVAMASA
jgi:hypothetical protein